MSVIYSRSATTWQGKLTVEAGNNNVDDTGASRKGRDGEKKR